MSVVLIDYGSGNLRSAAKACERVLGEMGRADSVSVTHDPDLVAAADRVILPGVGAFGDCKAGIERIDGLGQAIETAVHEKGRPFLGICVGMQLMASVGEEHGETAGFGWIPGRVTALKPADESLKIPHMGWNELDIHSAGHPVLAALPPAIRHAYFVHSFHLVPDDPAHVLAHATYGLPVTAMVGRDTMIGTQFHPEKSQQLGLALLKGFFSWTP